MKLDSRFAAVALAVLVTGACGEAPKPAPAAAPAPTQAAPAATVAAAAPAGAAEFGVPECDDFLNKYVACIDSKAPEAARAALRQGLDQSKAAWKQAASTPEGKATLATACKQQLEITKTAMAAYSCAW